MDSQPQPSLREQLAELRSRLSHRIHTFQPGPRTYIVAWCVGAVIGEFAAMAHGQSIPVAVATLSANLGVNLMADFIGRQKAPDSLTVDDIVAAVQTRLEQGDDLPAVRKLLDELDLIRLVMDSWDKTSDARYQRLIDELSTHPQLISERVTIAVVRELNPQFVSIDQRLATIQTLLTPSTGQRVSDVATEAAPALVAANPFGDRGAITDPQRFYDREELLRRIFEELEKGSSVSLVGDSEIGKSSLLHVVCQLGPTRIKRVVDGFVYLSLECLDDENEFYEALCSHLGIETCRGLKLKRALTGKQYILCLDEAEKMAWEQYGFTRKVRSHLRGLADGNSEPLTLVIASRSPLNQLFPDSPDLDSPLANICHQFDVKPFTRKEALGFLDKRLLDTGVTFTPSMVDALLEEVGGHPGKLQRAAADLYRRLSSAM